MSEGQRLLLVDDDAMPDCSGLQLLNWVTAQKLAMPVILMTGFATADQTPLACDRGCRNFLVNPLAVKALNLALREPDRARAQRMVAKTQSRHS